MTDTNQSGIEAERVTQIACADCGKVLDVAHLPSFSEVKCPECGLAQIVPAKFGGFLLVGRLGSGGMGMIYHAMDKELGRHVALKVMKKELGANREFVQSFKHEAQAAAALNHPNVVQIYSFGQVENQFYIAMELVSGGRLDEMIADGVPLEETRALEIHLQVVAGLRAASDVGLVHGDIKPANILFGQNGETKVVDFGLASFIGQQQQGGAVWGTPYYIAPEKARGKRVDFRSDIYSLGATFFHVLTGQPPFDGPTSTDVVMARLNQPAPNILDLNEDLHPETATMVARMLEAEPTMRYPSYPALQIDMEAAIEASRKPQKKTTASKKAAIKAMVPSPPRFNRKFLARGAKALAAVLLVAAIGYGAYAYHRHRVRTAAEAAERLEVARALEEGALTFGRINALAGLVGELGEPVLALATRIDRIASANSNLNIAAAQAGLEIDKALEILNDAEDARALADIALQDLQNAGSLQATLEPARQLEEYFNKMIEWHNTLPGYKAASEKVMADASAILAQANAAARQAREAAAQRAASEKAARDAQELARKQALEAERLRPLTIQSELDRVDQARALNVPLLAQYKIRPAIRSLDTVKDDLTQPETQAYYKNVRDAYESIAGFKDFVISSIHKAPYRAGWIVGQTPRDIVQADDTLGLTIALGKTGSVKIPWEKIPAAQLARIARYYLKAEKSTDDASARILLGIALFYYENGTFKMAETYATEVCEVNPELTPEVQRLMPGLVAE